MEHYVDVERAFCVEQYFRCESIVTVQRLFRKKFKVTRLKPVPTRNTIMRWVNNFRETANATNKKRPGKKKTVRTPETIERVRSALHTSPARSARRHAASLNLSRESVRRILVEDLGFHPYKLLITQELKITDHALRNNRGIEEGVW